VMWKNDANHAALLNSALDKLDWLNQSSFKKRDGCFI
jgi:hypothetical protein